MEFTYKDLVAFDQQGIIPGPTEDTNQYVKRAGYCLELKNKLLLDFKEQFPFSLQDMEKGEITENVFVLTSSLYGIAPKWLPIFFCNYKLLPWHGAAAWIFQVEEDEPTSALIQLRSPFLQKKVFLKLYNRDELLAHEMAHVGRMLFNEPKFEELLAYRSSSSFFSRYFGPIFESSAESMTFVLILLFIVLLDALFFLYAPLSSYIQLQWLKLIPCAFIGVGLVRLYRKHKTFNRALTLLTSWLKSETKANYTIYRLTDEEITLFAKMDVDEIDAFAKFQDSLRWELIKKFSL